MNWAVGWIWVETILIDLTLWMIYNWICLYCSYSWCSHSVLVLRLSWAVTNAKFLPARTFYLQRKEINTKIFTLISLGSRISFKIKWKKHLLFNFQEISKYETFEEKSKQSKQSFTERNLNPIIHKVEFWSKKLVLLDFGFLYKEWIV